MKKIIAFLIAAALAALTACGSGGGKGETNDTNAKQVVDSADLAFTAGVREYPYSLAQADPSEPLSVSQDACAAFADRLARIECEYPYHEYFGMAEMFDKLYAYQPVENHRYTALDSAGRLTAAHLAEIVKKNNAVFLNEQETATGSSFSKLSAYAELEDSLLDRICTLIVCVVDKMFDRFPDIDRDRVLCNLGYLKILHEERSTSLHLAAVDNEMLMKIHDQMLSAADLMMGEHAIRNTIVHETMHILQYGCACENIENCIMRQGFSYHFDSEEHNAASYLWMVEGSAEKEMSLLVGEDTMTYDTKIGYIETMDYTVFLQKDVPAYYCGSLMFYPDPEKLFGLFGCRTREEKLEVADLMRAVEILQNMPKDFKNTLAKDTDLDMTDEDVQSEIRFRMKPEICRFFTKYFYAALIDCAAREEMTENDLYCLLRLFEGLLDYHLGLWDGRNPEINKPFLTDYSALRSELFTLLKEQGNDVSISEYLDYDYFAGEDIVNARLLWMPEEKIRFIYDRMDFIAEKDLLKKPSPIE